MVARVARLDWEKRRMPRTMIAREYGGPEVLHLDEGPTREPGEAQVCIAVRAAGVNPADVKQLAGLFGRDPASLPLRPGSEVAGVVTAVGADAAGPAGRVTVGDEVVAYRVSGGFSDEVVAPARSVMPKPASLDWPEAAGLMLVGTTAWHLLEATGVGDGDRIIVHGASGAVGSIVTQLAVQRGATVVGTASAATAQRVRDDGGVPVQYGPGLEARLRAAFPDGADAALDTVGTDEALDSSVALVADRGRIATIAGFARGAELGIRMLGGGPGADPGSAVRAAARLPLLELAGSGRLHVRVGRTFPLDEAVDALRLVAGGHPGGKVVLLP